jgi:hypothetical protein
MAVHNVIVCCAERYYTFGDCMHTLTTGTHDAVLLFTAEYAASAL